MSGMKDGRFRLPLMYSAETLASISGLPRWGTRRYKILVSLLESFYSPRKNGSHSDEILSLRLWKTAGPFSRRLSERLCLRHLERYLLLRNLWLSQNTNKEAEQRSYNKPIHGIFLGLSQVQCSSKHP